MIQRIYVEKKKGFDVEAKSLFSELKESLHLDTLTEVRVINRYDINDLYDEDDFNAEEYKALKFSVFAEPAIDMVYDDVLDTQVGYNAFAVEYLPGQFDQRADSASTCIQLITMRNKPKVSFARVILLKGELDDSDLKKVISYCVNPVDSRIAEMDAPKETKDEILIPDDVEILKGFINFDKSDLNTFLTVNKLSMNLQDLQYVLRHFKFEEKRNPTMTEIKVIDTYWSDHCRHTTFLTKITDVKFKDGKYSKLFKDEYDRYLSIRSEIYSKDRDISLMDLATIGAKYLKLKGKIKNIDESEEINACSIKVKAVIDDKEEDWLVLFKNETHNHPTEIEPFGGAATCLGGAIRDPLSGRAYVYQAMRVTGSGDPRVDISVTLPGKLPQRKITREAAQGYSSYGNQIGVSTGQVREIYHPGYIAKRMEVGAVVGAVPFENVRREKPVPGDVVILVGGRTGRDGCGGASGSSKAHDQSSLADCGAEVQKGNPPVERNLQRLFRRKEASLLIKRCNDFGAGGVSVAVGELADSLDVNLDYILKKYDGLDGTELAISESQERMAVVVEALDAEKFIELSRQENLEAVVIGAIKETGRFRMIWRDKVILDLSRSFLDTNGLKQETKVMVDCISNEDFNLFDNVGDYYYKLPIANQNIISKRWKDMCKELNFGSQKGLVDRFDSTIGAGTVLMPYGGKYQLTPSIGMAAKLPVLKGYTDTSTLLSFGFDPYLSSKSPFHGGFYAVIESATKIVAMGGRLEDIRLSFQEYFESLGKSPEKWGQPIASLLGALKAQLDLQIPAIGGKDSMSGNFNELKVPPTLISFALATTSAKEIISQELKGANNKLIYFYNDIDENGLINIKQYKENMLLINSLASKNLIFSSNIVGKYGIAGAITEMSIGNKLGVKINGLRDYELFKNAQGGIIIEIDGQADLKMYFEGGTYKEIGSTIDNGKITVLGEEIPIEELIEEWRKPLEAIFPETGEKDVLKDGGKNQTPPAIQGFERSSQKSQEKVPKPKVVIAAFPGTNCEIDSQKAFEKAGGECEIVYIRNLTQEMLVGSIKNLADSIKKAQILMIPGGFSGGDEPDGSAKFITAVFRNKIVKDATMDLIKNRGGLVLGICNGFQALIKLGLLPYGEILDADENSPTLTYNKVGRHVSRFVKTKIVCVKSPWLTKVCVGDIHAIPVSHGEGRLIASEEVLNNLLANGQIATQYVDFKGEPTMDPEFNPNNSVWAIEGMTSVDGRIFGKMGHSERIGKNLYKNISGNMNQNIFEAGIAYFKDVTGAKLVNRIQDCELHGK
jgi:phosphoribosylformylglycinamidine synthase